MKRFRRLAWALPLALLLAGLSYSRPTPEDAIAQVFQSPNGELFELQLVRELRKEQLEEQRQQLIKYALNLIVMVGGQLAGSPTIGAGIIFGADKQNLYIATANHVVRRGQDKVEDLRINFQIRPFTALEAELLNAVDVDLDLAVIKLPYWGFVHEGMDACPPSFSMVGNIQLVKVGNSPAPPEVFSNVTMKRGDAVYPVGNPNGVAWGMPVTADRLASISGHVLTFESNFISRGHSGGALLSEAGGLLGMITADSPPFGRAVDLIAVLQRLSQWGLPVALHVALHAHGAEDRAVREGDVDELRRLITGTGYCVGSNIDLNELLVRGSGAGRLEIVKLLLDAGADPNYRRGDALVAAASRGSAEIVDLLLAKGVSASANSDPLLAAAEHGHVSIAERLLKAGFRSKFALYGAVENDNIEMLKLLLDHLDGKIEVQSSGGHSWRTPLQLAVCHGQLAAVQLLLKAGADVLVVDHPWGTLLHLALATRETLAHLARATGNEGQFPDCYSHRKDIEIVRLLIQAGCEINSTDDIGWAPLHLAVVGEEKENLIAFLLAHGADPNAQTKNGDTPMHIALYYHWLSERAREKRWREHDDNVIDKLSKIIKILLRAGAYPDLENAVSQSPRSLVEKAPSSRTRDEILHLMETARKGEEKAVVASPTPAPAPTGRTLKPVDTLRDCAECPEMIVISAGSFMMGSPATEPERYPNESPQHRVTIGPFAIGKTEVTFAEWDACVTAGGCNLYRPSDHRWGRGLRPVVDVSWKDAKAYVSWLSQHTGKPYRLPSEAEWEYSARAGTTTRYAFGDAITPKDANYSESKLGKTTEVGAYPPNAWGLHDMHGNVLEWVEDIYHARYQGAPTDGTAWIDSEGENSSRDRVLRDGSWHNDPRYLRSAQRSWFDPDLRYYGQGFRVARTLD